MMSIIRHFLIALIKSGYFCLTLVLGSHGCCKYSVTCSIYVVRQFKEYAFWTAVGRSLQRLASCHPFR